MSGTPKSTTPSRKAGEPRGRVDPGAGSQGPSGPLLHRVTRRGCGPGGWITPRCVCDDDHSDTSPRTRRRVPRNETLNHPSQRCEEGSKADWIPGGEPSPARVGRERGVPEARGPEGEAQGP